MIVDKGGMSAHACGMLVKVVKWTTKDGHSAWLLDRLYTAPNGHVFNRAIDAVLTPVRYRSGVDQMVARMRVR